MSYLDKPNNYYFRNTKPVRETKAKVEKPKRAQKKPHHCVFGASLDPRYRICGGCGAIEKKYD